MVFVIKWLGEEKEGGRRGGEEKATAATEIICGQQSLKYLLSGPYQKKFAIR